MTFTSKARSLSAKENNGTAPYQTERTSVSTNPFEVVVTAAIEQAASVARAALLVAQVAGAEAAEPLSTHANAILDAVKLVRP